jgi:predicted cobalt transporter CbtA
MGTYGMVWAIAFVFGPSLGMALFSINSALLWAVCGLMGIVAAALISAPAGERVGSLPQPSADEDARGRPGGQLRAAVGTAATRR